MWARAAGWRVPPLRSPPWRPHTLSARNHSGVSVPCDWLLACCTLGVHAAGFRPPPPSTSRPAQHVPLVALWPSLLPGSPALAGLTAVPVGASKLYSRRASAPCSGLAPLVPEVCLVRVPALLLSAAMPRCGRSGAVLCPPIRSLALPPAPCALVARVVGGFSSPPRPCPSSPGTPSPNVVTPGVFPPCGNSATPGVSVSCGYSTHPYSPWQDPRGCSATPEASRPPSLSPTMEELWATPEALQPPSPPRTPEDFPAGFSCRPADLPFCTGLFPWRLPRSCLVGGRGGRFPSVSPA